jgi:hypothetical protein
MKRVAFWLKRSAALPVSCVVVSAALIALTAMACGSSPQGVDAAVIVDGAKAADAARTFPAVCQKMSLLCPDQASLDKCEADSGQAFSLCAPLPITLGCTQVSFNTTTCPSKSQICRTAEISAGYCTHSCVNDADCPLGNGSNGTCTTINGVVKICTRDQ